MPKASGNDQAGQQTSVPTWDTFADYLIEKFPELREQIEAEYFDYSQIMTNPMPHFFLSDFLLPMLAGTLQLRDDWARLRAGEVLDQLLSSSDMDLVAAAKTSVVTIIRDTPSLREAAWPFLGPKAKAWAERQRH